MDNPPSPDPAAEMQKLLEKIEAAIESKSLSISGEDQRIRTLISYIRTLEATLDVAAEDLNHIRNKAHSADAHEFENIAENGLKKLRHFLPPSHEQH